jgi:2'-5' RNA ligase
MLRSVELTARTFFALVPPPAVQQALGGVARETARHAHGRPVPAENLHITLAFLGAWPLAQLPMLLDAAAGVRGDPLRIVLDNLGMFRRAGIAWIGPSTPSAGLMQLQAALAAALTAVGVALDQMQGFRPHVTLARRCRGPYPRGMANAIAFDVDRFSLMQSDTRAEGARYRTLAEWPLSGSAG